MKNILPSFLVLSIGLLAPATLPLAGQPSWAQTQNPTIQEAERLLEQGEKQTEQGQSQKSIKTFQQALLIAQKLQDRKLEAKALLGLGANYFNIGQRQKALNYYEQALLLFRKVVDASG